MEPVFATPDPAEAERVRALLDARGLSPEMEIGPDPVTGVGGAVFGGGGARIVSVLVPASLADAARDLLTEMVPPGNGVVPEEEHPAEAPLPMTRLRRIGPPVIALFFFLDWLVLVLVYDGADFAIAKWIAATVALLAGTAAIFRSGGRAAGPQSR